VVEAPSADPSRFAAGAVVYADRQPAVVVESKTSGGRLVVRLDRPVERGVLLELPAEELPELPEGEYYAFQLVGLVVVDDRGRTLGRVAGVAPGVANDILELDTGISLPLVDDWVLDVDLDGRRVVVRPVDTDR
jgi:16S rRNA processing protein RimM